MSVLSMINPCVLSGFRREVDENCGFVGYYAVKSGTLEIGPIGCPKLCLIAQKSAFLFRSVQSTPTHISV